MQGRRLSRDAGFQQLGTCRASATSLWQWRRPDEETDKAVNTLFTVRSHGRNDGGRSCPQISEEDSSCTKPLSTLSLRFIIGPTV